MSKEVVKALIESLERRVDFHRNNPNDDPYGIGNAVIAALSEVIEALKEVNE